MSGPSHRQSRGPSAAYQSSYNALMTPNSDNFRSVDDARTPLECVNLSSLQRMYPRYEEIFLLSATNVVSIWLSELFLKAEHSQPLLMPVAVSLDNVSERLLALLNASHFEVNKVAGKYRLQQVPAGTRHLPWLKWFEHLLMTIPDENCDALDRAITSLVLPAYVLDEDMQNQVWYWLDEQSEVKQWEIIEQFAKVRPLKQVLDVWGE